MTSDSATGFSLPPDERPLGIQQPFLPSLPLGQSVLQPKFLTPLGARSLTVLDPNLFSADSAALGSDPGLPFQDSPFFDGPSDRPEPSNIATASPSSTSQSPSSTTLQPKLENLSLETAGSLPTGEPQFESGEPPSANGRDFVEWEQPAAIAPPEPTVEPSTSTPASIQPKLASQPIAPEIQMMREVSGFEMPARSPEASRTPAEDAQGAIASPEPTFESSTSTPETIQPKLESQPTTPTIQAMSKVSKFEMPERSPEVSSLSIEDQQNAISSSEPTFESSTSTPEAIQPKLESQPTTPTMQAISEVSGFEMPARSAETLSFPVEDQQCAIASPEPTFESSTSTPETIQPKLESQPTTPTIQAISEVSGFEMPARSAETPSFPVEDQQGAIAFPEPTFESPTLETIQPKLESQAIEPTIQAMSEVSGVEMPELSPEIPSFPVEDRQDAIASPEPTFESSTSTPETIQPKLESQPTEPTIQAVREVSGFDMSERSPETPGLPSEDQQGAFASPEPTFESPASTPDTIQPKLESPQIEPTIQAMREVSGFEMPERSPETSSLSLEDQQGAISSPESTFESSTPTPETIQPKLESQAIEPTIQAMSEVSGFDMSQRSSETSSLPIEDQQGEISPLDPTFEPPTSTPETIQPKLESQPTVPMIQAESEVSGFEMSQRSPETPSFPVEDRQDAIALPEPTFESPTPTQETIQPKLESQPTEPTIQAAREVSGFEMPERSPETPSFPLEDQQGAIASPEPNFEPSTSSPATIQPQLESQPIGPEIQMRREGSSPEILGRLPGASRLSVEEQQGAIAPVEQTFEASTSTPAAIQPKLESQPTAPTIQAASEVSGFEMPGLSPEASSLPLEDPQDEIARPEPTFESPTSTPETIQPKLESQSTEPTIQAMSEVSGFEMPERSLEASSLPIENQQSTIASPEPTFASSTPTPETIQPKLESQAIEPTIQAMSEVSEFEMPERSPETPSLPVDDQPGAIALPEPTFESPTPTPETIQPKLESQPTEPMVQALSEVSGFEMPELSPETFSLPIEDQQVAISSPEPNFEPSISSPETIQPKLKSQPTEPTIQAASEVSGFETPERSPEASSLPIEDQQNAIASPEPAFESPTPTPETIQLKLESPQIEPTIQAASEVSGFEMPERSSETSSLPIEDQQGAIALPETTLELSTPATPATLQPKSDTQLIPPQQPAPEPPRIEEGSEESEPAPSTTTSALPELPATLQRLSVWEPLIQTQPLNAAIAPHLTPPDLQPALAIPTADRTPPSDRASTTEPAAAFEPFSLASDRASNATSSSPAPSEWSSIAELFQTDSSSQATSPSQTNSSSQTNSPPALSPDITPGDGYTDLRLYPDPDASAPATVQRELATGDEIAAPPPSNSPTPEQASGESPAPTNPEQLEQLAQAVYRLVRQRLALERERGGHPPPGRFS